MRRKTGIRSTKRGPCKLSLSPSKRRAGFRDEINVDQP